MLQPTLPKRFRQWSNTNENLSEAVQSLTLSDRFYHEIS